MNVKSIQTLGERTEFISERQEKEWLSNDIINAVQHILMWINPVLSGFQITACGLVLNFSSETREFVPILYEVNHWNNI